MRKHVTELQPGEVIQSDVFNNHGLHVMSPGTVISEHYLNLLFRHQVEYVEVDERSVTPEASASSAPPHRMQAVYDDSVEQMKAMFDKAFQEGRLSQAEVDRCYDPLVETMNQQTDVVDLLMSLNSKDDYTYEHCIQVGMLSFYLAKWLNYSDQEAHEIGKAGFLHDIGKSKIHQTILQKPSKLTDEEYAEIKRHTLYGFEIISTSIKDTTAALVALQHHERNNGSGYPHGTTAKQIHPVSSIVAVADIYSAMISSRVYQKARDLFVVLRELYQLSFSELDPTVTHTFIRRMIPHFIGKKVQLSDGKVGTIITNHTNDFFRPLVNVHGEFLDLSRSNIEIEKILTSN